MAKRTKLTAPSAEELAALDASFRSENIARPNPGTAPIAQVAAESARASTGTSAQQQLDRLDAEQLRAAQTSGRLIIEIPTDKINADAMIRDRSVLNEDELTELKLSIRANGLRLPVEVYEGADGSYNLLSGYRRLMAVRGLADLNPDKGYDTIKALIRPPAETADSFAAMVEENEIRASLSHYERGRIAVIAANQGAFANTEAAVTSLFTFASAAKKSKIKSFAEVFEMLGDMLAFPETLSERRGLRLANALRQGAVQEIRDALASGQGTTPDLEWAVLEGVITQTEDGPAKVAKLGRPKMAPPVGWEGKDTLHLSSGISLRKERDSNGFIIRFTGKGLTADLIDSAMEELRRLLERP